MNFFQKGAMKFFLGKLNESVRLIDQRFFIYFIWQINLQHLYEVLSIEASIF
jgi:hypothetical protein